MVIQFNILVVSVFCFWLASCTGQVEKVGLPISQKNYLKPQAVNINHDSLQLITPGEKGIPLPNRVAAGIPRQVTNRLLSVPASTPTVVKIDTSNLVSIIPGENGIPQPKSYSIPESGYTVQHGDTISPPIAIVARQPQPVKALAAHVKDNAVYNIKCLDMDQGLPFNIITSIHQDEKDMMWFATDGGGVSRYDGNSFVTFTETEGLANDFVFSLLQDKKGDFWFGTNNGVSHYDGKTFTNYSNSEGLENNGIWSILEVSSGDIWFSTGLGVSRFDGQSFTSFSEKEGLANSWVNSMLEDKNGNIWFATDEGGLSRYDGHSFMTFNESHGLPSNSITAILEDKNGKLWFSTTKGVCSYDGEIFTSYTKEVGMVNDDIWSMMKDESGNLWFGSLSGGVMRFDGSSFTSFTEREGLVFNSILSMLEDRAGNIWFGTGSGVSRYEKNSFTNMSEEEGLPDNTIKSIKEDKKGNLWLGTAAAGVSKFDGTTYTTFTEKEGLPNNSVWSILEDRKGNLWFGTGGGGASRFDGNTFTTFTNQNGLESNYIWSMLEDKKGNIWFATSGGVSFFDGKHFTQFPQSWLSQNLIVSIVEDDYENIWFGSYGGGLSSYNGKSITNYTEAHGLNNNQVLPLFKDKIGNIWAGTDAGISLFSTFPEGEISIQQINMPNKQLNYIMAITQDRMDRIWIGTEYGLVLYTSDTTNSTATANSQFFNKMDGLKNLDVNVQSTYLDSKNQIWWGMTQGITMLDLNTFESSHAVPSIVLNDVNINGTFVDFSRLENDKDSHPSNSIDQEQKTRFSGVECSAIAPFQNLPEQLSLAHDLNHLSFQYTAIDWAAPNKLRYRYLLEGLDEDWNELTHETQAEYRNLPPGKFTFKVKSIGAAQKWSETYEYPFTIRPPWWLSWWAKTLYVSLAIGLIISTYQLRTRTLKKQRKKLQLQVAKRTQELKIQNSELKLLNKEKDGILSVVAHDLRSPFNHIKGLTELVENGLELNEEQQDYFQKINQAINQGKQLINDLLDVSNFQQNNSSTQLNIQAVDVEQLLHELHESSKKYAVLKQQELSFISDVSTPLNTDRFLLWRVLENLISNAIKYSPNGKPIVITARPNKEQIEFIIKDEGLGFSEEDKNKMFGKFQKLSAQPTGNEISTGLGLSIVKLLVEKIGGTIKLESELNLGSKFIVSIPDLL